MAPADPALAVPGDEGIGDPYYPRAGNGGYDVTSTDLDLQYDPASNRLAGTATLVLTVTAGQGLSRFNLDLEPTMTVEQVRVGDADAAFEQQGAELLVTPAAPMATSAPQTVQVRYGGIPGTVAFGTGGLGDGGWFRTPQGGALALGQPFSASAWYPVNDHPADTATFAVTMTVPAPWKVISNGVQVTEGLPDPGAGQSVFRWELAEPVASYLTTVYIDQFTTTEETLADGTPVISAFAPGVPARDRLAAAQTTRVLEVLTQHFGPYPFNAAGGIYLGLALGFALETATRPTYAIGGADISVVVHEQAHQWFGDAITIATWADICLNECFASYATWLWNEDVDGADLNQRWERQLREILDNPNFWSSPLVDMGPGREFTRVYDRGPLALHALRAELGEAVFDELLLTWVQRYDGKNASWADLQALINELAGRDLNPFVDAWFRGTTAPPEEFRYPGDLGP